MKMRNIPLLLSHYEKSGKPPVFMSLGFAAYLLFMKGDTTYVKTGGDNYITDDKAVILQQKWKLDNTAALVKSVLEDVDLWGADLSALPGFKEAVTVDLKGIMNKGALKMTEMTVMASK
jgi:tagaturonate reductase